MSEKPEITEAIPEKAKTIANPINADISVLDLTVKSYNALKRMEINTVAELETRTADVMKMLPKTYPRIFEAVEKYTGKPITSSGNEFAADENAVDNTTEPAEKKQELIPAPAEEPPAVFDYSELNSDRAKKIASSFNYALLTAEMGDFLKRKEQQLKNEYMNFTANCGQIFAEAQEKLARDGHGVFVKWIEYMGFKAPTVYRMIDVYKFRLSHFEKDETEKQEIFETLPKMLQYDISAKSAPLELVEQVMNGDITTHKDYIALKKQLEDAQKQAENAEMQSRTYQKNYLQMSKNFDEACEENTNLDERIKELEKQLKEATDKSDDKKIAELEAQVKELEKRDIQVVFEKDETEINRLQEENTQLEKQLREAQDELMFAAPPADDIKIFAVKLTLEEYEALTDIADKYGSAIIGQAVKNAQIIRI